MKSDGPNHMDPHRNEVDTVGSGKSTTKKDNLPAIWPNSSHLRTKKPESVGDERGHSSYQIHPTSCLVQHFTIPCF